MFLPRIFDNNYMDRFFDDHFLMICSPSLFALLALHPNG